MIEFLKSGIIIGFTIGAVVGPIGILCINQSISNGILAGLAVGIGAALADTFYGALAAFGLTKLCDILLQWQLPLKFIGSIYLIWLGYTTFNKKANYQNQAAKKEQYANLITTTFFLTITSPVTILAFLAIFSTYNLQFCATNYLYAGVISLGVFLGSMLWWIILSSISSQIGKKLSSNELAMVNRLSGLVIGGFGLYILIKSLYLLS